jgi:pimeloyl-ACP methyl ester carboxylesterase
VEVTARTVASLVFGALYSPTTAAMLPILLDRAAHDDFQSLVALAMASDSGENMSIGMQLSVLCSEDAPRISAPDVEKESAGSVFGGNLAVDQIAACESWPRGPVDPGFYQPVTSNVPVLILSGEIDPVTPSSWGEEVAKHLPHSRHVVAPATGHGVVGTPCGARLVIDFLDRGNAESLDTSCVRALRRPPFFVSLAGPDPLAGAK